MSARGWAWLLLLGDAAAELAALITVAMHLL